MIRIKICGLSRPCDIDFVNEAKPDYCGFVIDVPKSRRNVPAGRVRELYRRLDDGILPVGVFVNAPPETVSALLREGVIAAAQLHGEEDETYIKKLRSMTDALLIKAFSVIGPDSIKEANKSSADYVLLDQGAGGTGKPFDWTLLRGLRRPYFLAGGLTQANLPAAMEAALRTAPQMMPGTALGDAPQTVPGTVFGDAPDTVTGTVLGNAPQTVPGTALGNAPQTVPGTALGNAPDTTSGTALGAASLLHCVDLSSGVEKDGYKDRDKILAAVAAVRRFGK